MSKNYTEKILSELYTFLEGVKGTGYNDICEAIENADHIFLAGIGRTGYIMRCFAMRLAQLGFRVYWIGDSNTCSARVGDLLILGSGSGETEGLINYIKKAVFSKLSFFVWKSYFGVYNRGIVCLKRRF